jgi:hypothetical protein
LDLLFSASVVAVAEVTFKANITRGRTYMNLVDPFRHDPLTALSGLIDIEVGEWM